MQFTCSVVEHLAANEPDIYIFKSVILTQQESAGSEVKDNKPSKYKMDQSALITLEPLYLQTWLFSPLKYLNQRLQV